MRKDRNLILYRVIANEDHTIEMNIGDDIDDDGLFMPSLTFCGHELLEDDIWDSEDYIFKDFYQFLLRWKGRRLTSEDFLVFNQMCEKLDEETANELLDIIELSVELGWYKYEQI